MALTTVKTSALTGDINLTSQVTGTLPTANGGTGATSFTSGKTFTNYPRTARRGQVNLHITQKLIQLLLNLYCTK